MNLRIKHFDIIYIVGGVLLLVGAMLQPDKNQRFAPYIFATGALFVIAYHFLEAVKFRKSSNFQQKRFYGMCFLVSALLLPAVYLMFENQRYWLVLLLIYCVTIFYLTFREGKIKIK
ncbi:MAG: hypothetical protein LBS01_00465 [Prevotellaceae bacterium]|jgi:phosphatidylserine synthase|nr:hypothetical protein [Prevotellaceae bacterium]